MVITQNWTCVYKWKRLNVTCNKHKTKYIFVRQVGLLLMIFYILKTPKNNNLYVETKKKLIKDSQSQYCCQDTFYKKSLFKIFTRYKHHKSSYILCHTVNSMTLNFGGEWDTMGANAWWIHIIAWNQNQDYIENTFNWKSLSKNLPPHQQHEC